MTPDVWPLIQTNLARLDAAVSDRDWIGTATYLERLHFLLKRLERVEEWSVSSR